MKKKNGKPSLQKHFIFLSQLRLFPTDYSNIHCTYLRVLVQRDESGEEHTPVIS